MEEKQKPNQSEKNLKNLKEWHEFATQNHLSGEWAVAAKLGKTGFSEEEIHWVSEMFGR
ncbi:MAG: hypothetical protein IKI22_04930 [Neisseriaceae bacterium]|nr:hypothetical protein [Neisseriaceae bacterium]